jgi:lysophospholipase L1-like esterase
MNAVPRACLCILALTLALRSSAELILTNYSLGKPLKVMSIGDSITDDCVYNGAWRAPLQPLLEGSGINFTNVGRYYSTAQSGFTKLRHEGFCGSVIAAPGMFGPVHGYASQDNYLLRTERDGLSIAMNRPDLVLVLIGANDLGRGRNPYQVATNDMAALLGMIFSNAPNAQVLLAKPTTLQDATLGYGLHATNVPVYSAALQALVNQRQAAGAKVFLADMFSAVDYATMFESDHLHPNPLGLQAIAKEWLTRIQGISTSPNHYVRVLVNGGAAWKYFDRGEDPGPGWAQPAFDDSGWSNGVARFGYGDAAVATTVSFGADAGAKHPTTCFRRAFVVPPSVAVTNLNLRLARADGAVVWLNGQEVFRVNLPGGPMAFTNLALSRMTGYSAHVFQPNNLSGTGLVVGTNLLAVEVHLSSPTNATLGFDLELIAMGRRLPPPALAIAASGGNALLRWRAVDGAGHSLYSATNLLSGAAWDLVPASQQTNGSDIVVTQAVDRWPRYYRLQGP